MSSEQEKRHEVRLLDSIVVRPGQHMEMACAFGESWDNYVVKKMRYDPKCSQRAIDYKISKMRLEAERDIEHARNT